MFWASAFSRFVPLLSFSEYTTIFVLIKKLIRKILRPKVESYMLIFGGLKLGYCVSAKL